MMGHDANERRYEDSENRMDSGQKKRVSHRRPHCVSRRPPHHFLPCSHAPFSDSYRFVCSSLPQVPLLQACMRCSALRFTPLRFDDPKLVFSSRSTAELLRAALVFRVAGIPWVVRNARRLVRGSYAVLGTTVTEAVLRATFFSHFCGGTDLESVTPTVHKLERLGIGSILDYAAEKDVDSGGKKKEEGEVAGMSKEERSAGVMSARTFSYEGEESCEENKHIFLQCIDHVCAASPNAFAAIKLTAIGRPELLRRISEILAHVKAIYFAHASGKIGSGDRSDETSPVRMSKEELEACLKGLGIDEAKKIIDSQMWHALDMDGDGFVSFEEWTSFLHPSNPGAQIIFSNFENSKNLKNSNNLKFLNAGELAELNGLVNRLEEIASYAATKKVRLMIDAEQSYFQDAIDLLVKDLQRRYNVKFPAIYNTYQCYLRSSFFRAESDMKLAKEQGWIFAAKIVRGAYMVQVSVIIMHIFVVC